jgi:exodeoxyribonuclease VII large subunit
VGHETDFTICDFVADVRAPTPSAAAEILSPELSDLIALFNYYADLFQKQLQQKIALHRQQLLHLSKRLRHPGHTLREQQQKLDHLEWRLQQAALSRLRQPQQKLAQLAASLNNLSPLNTLQRGYAIATTDAGTVLTHIEQAHIGMTFDVQLFRGKLRGRIETIYPDVIDHNQ